MALPRGAMGLSAVFFLVNPFDEESANLYTLDSNRSSEQLYL